MTPRAHTALRVQAGGPWTRTWAGRGARTGRGMQGHRECIKKPHHTGGRRFLFKALASVPTTSGENASSQPASGAPPWLSCSKNRPQGGSAARGGLGRGTLSARHPSKPFGDKPTYPPDPMTRVFYYLHFIERRRHRWASLAQDHTAENPQSGLQCEPVGPASEHSAQRTGTCLYRAHMPANVHTCMDTYVCARVHGGRTCKCAWTVIY